MREIVGAALGAAANRILLFEPTPGLCKHLSERPETTFLAVTAGSRRAIRKCYQQDLSGETMTPTVCAGFLSMTGALPLAEPGFDAVVLAGGLPQFEEPRLALRSATRLVRSGGAVIVVSRIRQGTVGNMTSMLGRVTRRSSLPRSSELCAWMLEAGMRKVRQADIPRAVVPTVMTWAEARLG